MVVQPQEIFEFGDFRLDLSDHLLLKNGKPVALTPKAFEVLILFVQQRGRLIQKEELMQKVWADSFVEEANLARTVWMLRKSMDADQSGKSCIETIPKLGYRFVANLTEVLRGRTPSVRERPDFIKFMQKQKEQWEQRMKTL